MNQIVPTTFEQAATPSAFAAATSLVGEGPRLIENRTMFNKGARPGKLSTLHLEEVRDLLRRQSEAQDPVSFDRSADQLHMDFQNGRVTAQFLTRDGLDPEVMLVHKNAYDQLSRTVLPSRFGKGLLEQAELGAAGEKLSTMSWALFSQGSDKPVKIRSVRTRDKDGTVRRMLRSQHSQTFAEYDNLRFVEDLLSNAPELAAMAVLDFKVTDTLMRLRFCTEDVGTFELNKPMPIIEAYNSEAGRRSTLLTAAIWKLICTNGMQTFSEKDSFRWIHSGNIQRISDGVASAVENLQTKARGVVKLYNKALDVSIDDAFAFMTRELKREKLTKEQINRATAAIGHEWNAPGETLATVIDATTLIAQQFDMFEQANIERAAARMMQRGLAAADNGRILVHYA